MCGIVGFQGSYDRTLLRAMTDAVAHRGPDGEGIAMLPVEGRTMTGLGHRRLSIIDLSEAGRQPMTAFPDPGGGMLEGLTLTYNGEIYNYRELRDELLRDGHSFKTKTDSEILLHLYERDGLGMLDRLNGIFAFALHDARPSGQPEGVDRGTLIVARDPLGVKPLYYAETPRGFLFASEIKALLHDPELSRALDPVALHHVLAYLWTPAPRTALAVVRKLEPGAAMLVQCGRVRKRWSYYRPPADGTTRSDSEAVLTHELAARVQTAVERQLVSDVPVGAFLSGGLDSSAIVAMMRRLNPSAPITCFGIGVRDDGDLDGNPADLPYARRVAQHLNVDLHEIEMDPSAIDRLPEMVELLDEPQADPAPINALMIAERSRALGIPVLLSGAGGDDLFGGYRRHVALMFERRWDWLPHAVRDGIQSTAAAAASGSASGQSHQAIRRLSKMFAYAGLDDDRRLVSYFWWSTETVRRALYSGDFARELASVDTAAPLLETLGQIPNEHDRLQRMLYLETRHFLADHNLNYTDRAGMAVGVEVRVPLLDLDLVRFAAQVPSRMKVQARTSKAIFKRAMEPYLPREVIYRPKTGFGAPLRRWLARELRPMLDDTLSPQSLAARGLFDAAAVGRLVALDRAGRVDGSYTLFALLCIELWCRRFID